MQRLRWIVMILLGMPTLAHANKCRAHLINTAGAEVNVFTNSKGCEEARRECLNFARANGHCGGVCRDENATTIVTCNAPAPQPPQPAPQPPRPPRPPEPPPHRPPEPPRPPRPPFPEPEPPHRPPRPGPHRPPHGGSTNVQGTIESTSFNFDVSSVNDLYNQCVSFAYRYGLHRNDDITVVVDFGRLSTLRNGPSYWSEEESCQQVASVARAEGLDNDFGDLSVSGRIEQYSYHFAGRSRADIGEQCYDFAANLGNVDDITVSVNAEPEITLRNGPSYWRTKYEICEQILRLIED